VASFVFRLFTTPSQGCQIFVGKMYQITKWLKLIPNGHKIYQHLSLQDTPKFTQSWIFGLKIYLANLGANTTIVSYYASILKIFKTMNT
jgi:hypothetical protein